MPIGEVIRKYRKIKNMTQDEMADRLGVSAPAVNKWEKGNSMPDVALLAPIARLLGISLDTLLCYQGDLTDEEINALVREAQERLEKEEYGEVFSWAKRQMESYPNCERLLLWLTVVLDAYRLAKAIPHAQKYDEDIQISYERLLVSNDEYVRTKAADSLYGFYLRKEEYGKAGKYLAYFSSESPVKKMRQALLYEREGRAEEAYRTYEEMLFSGYQLMSQALYRMMVMRIQEEDFEKAGYLEGKLNSFAHLFEMGEFHEYMAKLDLMQAKKDMAGTLESAGHMLSGIETMGRYGEAPLYEHMAFQALTCEFKEKMRENLITFFHDEEAFGYMKGNEQWLKMLELSES